MLMGSAVCLFRLWLLGCQAEPDNIMDSLACYSFQLLAFTKPSKDQVYLYYLSGQNVLAIEIWRW